MVPVVKKNYNIYGERPRNLTTSDSSTDGSSGSRKTSHGSFGSSGSGGRKRVQSEGSILCSSPSHNNNPDIVVQRVPIPIQRNNNSAHHPPLAGSAGTRSFPLGMSRGKGSAPVLMQPPQLLRNNSLPEGPIRSGCPKSPSRSMSSDSSSSSPPTGDGDHQHGFHLKFVNKFKNSFRRRETAPAAT